MKKFFTFILSLVLALTPLTAFATTPAYNATYAKMGDINRDGKINAADARLALRIASKIDKTNIDFYRTDADGNGKITAADAREILRVAAGLSQFVYGFDGNRKPCAINTLKSGKYTLTASYKDEGSAELMKMTLAQDGENVYLMSSGIGIDMGSANFSSCGMMINQNEIYAILANNEISAAMHIPESMCSQFGMSKEEIIKMTDMVNTFIPDDIGYPQNGTLDGEDIFYYTYEIENQSCMLFVAENGKLLSLDCEMSNGDVETVMVFDSVSGDSTSSIFNLDNYELI